MPGSQPASRTRLLLVHSDRSQRARLAAAFRAEGFDVGSCQTAKRAIPRLERERVDVAVLVLPVPDCEALDLAAQLDRFAQEIPVVVCLPDGLDPRARNAFQEGPFACVEAKQGPGGLTREVHRTVRAWLGQRGPRLAEERERRRAEEELRASRALLEETLDQLRSTREQVIRQERLRALGEMASGIGHDLNNSLSPVLGYSEMLLDDPRLPEALREWVQWIHTGARDSAAIVARLREFYREPDPLQRREPVPMAELLREVIELTTPKWRDEAQREGRQIQVRLELEDAPPVTGSAAELRELLTNLIFNAVDALPSGGHITLRLRSQRDVVLVDVQDDGVGMAEHVRAKCLEPFFSTKGQQGTGLGLSVCHGIVGRHGGRMEIHSALGQGTTVRVHLPRRAEAGERELSEGEIDLPARRILYIDDDPRLRAVVSAMLRQLGQEVEVANGGADGLRMFHAAQERYDAVITDLGMPGLSGIEVRRTVKALRPEMPVILLTGWGTEPAENTVSRDWPEYVLSKPPTMDQLRQVLAKVLA